MVTEPDSQKQAVTLVDVVAVREGDSIAVRVVQESTEWILAG
jgi:hypothetical protein